MYTDDDKCIMCGKPIRPGTRGLPLLEVPTHYHGLAVDGEFQNTGCWFCSTGCYLKAVKPHISDPEYGFNKHYYEHEHFLMTNGFWEQCIGYRNQSKLQRFLDRATGSDPARTADEAEAERNAWIDGWMEKQKEVIDKAEWCFASSSMLNLNTIANKQKRRHRRGLIKFTKVSIKNSTKLTTTSSSRLRRRKSSK
jgi:hypothetical protein